MKKYAAYNWMADDEGGTEICFASDWSPEKGYRPWTGWRARPSVLIGYFDTAEELAKLMYDEDNRWKSEYEKAARENKNPRVKYCMEPLERISMDEFLVDAREMIRDFMEDYLYGSECYDECYE